MDETTGASSKEEMRIDYQDANNSSTEDTGHVEKHVHFSDNVEMVTQENEQEMSQEKQSSEVIKIGDVKVSSKWLHMDTVEHEKLEWMKDCRKPSALDSKVLFSKIPVTCMSH